MAETEPNGGCVTHGLYNVCGHTTATCPDTAKKEQIKKMMKVFESNPETQVKKLQIENLEKKLKYFQEKEQRNEEDEQQIDWLKTEIKISQRELEGKPIEGETEEEKEEYRNHTAGKMTDEEIEEAKARLKRMNIK